MNWDWEKLKKQQRGRGGPSGGGVQPPDFEGINEKLRRLKNVKLPGGKLVAAALVLLWIASGIYIVDPDEIGVVTRFGAYNMTTPPGPHYHIPYPVESVDTPKVTRIRRTEIGYRSLSRDRNRPFEQGQTKDVPEEALTLTGDENIVNVQFIVQYMIKDPMHYLFNVSEQENTVKSAAEAAMREVIGKSKIDAALTTGKLDIQNQTLALMQNILDRYSSGIRVVAVQLQNVHPPDEVVDAFKDVASAREDKSRYINEADAYRNDLLPKARGQAAIIQNQAEAYKESKIRQAKGDAARFLSVVREYNKAK
ncbi:MAG: FtsH protease activity modulator HflK, partial [Desulfovibrionaceae bacterium]|nr:FtsH protease activity modulator HflK [Desulfovibrionaceae bacterium]